MIKPCRYIILFCILIVLTAAPYSTAASAGKSEKIEAVPSAVEIIDVFVAGKEKVKGCGGKDFKWFREQNIIITNDGTVVVICQGRNKSGWPDRSGQDLVCKYSKDNGSTWSDAILIVTHGEKSICPNASVYDRRNNRIITLYNLFMWPYTDAESRKTFKGKKHRQFMVYSDDEGKTWSKPIEISPMMRTQTGAVVFGSGEGIQLRRGPHKGRLIIPGGDFDGKKKIYTFYSDDGGKTWNCGEPVPTPKGWFVQCENKIAELPDGTLIMNNRNHLKTYRRRAFSKDGGVTWSMLEYDKFLPAVSCNAGLHVYSDPIDGQKSRLLYSGPVGPGRTHGTVFLSYDGGKTWPVKKLIVPQKFAYSSIVRLPNGKIGLFYETDDYKRIALARFSLEWLTDGKDKLSN